MHNSKVCKGPPNCDCHLLLEGPCQTCKLLGPQIAQWIFLGRCQSIKYQRWHSLRQVFNWVLSEWADGIRSCQEVKQERRDAQPPFCPCQRSSKSTTSDISVPCPYIKSQRPTTYFGSCRILIKTSKWDNYLHLFNKPYDQYIRKYPEELEWWGTKIRCEKRYMKILYHSKKKIILEIIIQKTIFFILSFQKVKWRMSNSNFER